MTSPVCPLKSFIQASEAYIQLQSTILTGIVAANQLVVAAAAGKRIRVYSAIFTSTAAAIAGVSFLSASGGTLLFSGIAPSNAGTPPDNKIPFTLAGHFETNTGEGLYCSVGTTTTYVFITYGIYTPG